MATTNGVRSASVGLEDDEIVSNPLSKRKREESATTEAMNGKILSKTITRPSRDSQLQIDDFIQILKSIDTKPSVLERELLGRDTSSEPQAKRKKADTSSTPKTILSRASAGQYTTLQDALKDVKLATSSLYDSLRAVPRNKTNRPTESSQTAEKVVLLRKKAEEMVKSEEALELARQIKTEEQSEDSKTLSNGASHEKSTVGDGSSGRTVLTVFAHAPGSNPLHGANGQQPRQLFSSFQKSASSATDASYALPSLQDSGLPPGIGMTDIEPVDQKKSKSNPLTLAGNFSNITSAIPFPAPKPSRNGVTRSLQLGFYQPSPSDSSRTHNIQTYFTEKLEVGHWLDYAGTPGTLDVKRRQRERALSLSGNRNLTANIDSAEQIAAKAEALFRSAYSEFAPSSDNSGAVISKNTIDRIWWKKHGEKNFQRIVTNFTDLDEPTSDSTFPAVEDGVGGGDELDLEEIQDTIQNWDTLFIDPQLENSEPPISKSIADKDVEEILKDITELLETLNSYQRNRNLTINPHSRPAMGSSLSSSVGTPAEPSEAETATYETLKSQLSLMIAMLPPYAVAKLNSDQLSELSISTKVKTLTESRKGVMAIDEIASRAKLAEMRQNTNPVQRQSVPAPSNRNTAQLYGNQYAAPSPRVISGPGIYNPNQTPVRPPGNRQPSTSSLSYGGVRPVNINTYQSSNSHGNPTYPHQVARPQSQYGPAMSPQQYGQRNPMTPGYGTTTSQNYNSAALAGSRYQSSNHSAYQQNQVRPQPNLNGMNSYHSSGISQQGSPQKPLFSPLHQPSQMQNRPYGTPTPSMPTNRQYFPPQALTNGAASGPASISHSSMGHQAQSGHHGLGPSGYHTVMSPEEQSSIMERQRAQLTQQQGTQQMARHAAQVGTSARSPGRTNGV